MTSRREFSLTLWAPVLMSLYMGVNMYSLSKNNLWFIQVYIYTVAAGFLGDPENAQRQYTEGSKSNIPCFALPARHCSTCAQHLHRIRGCDAHPARIRRESGANVSRKICVRCASCSPRTSCKCCAQLPREECATRDVTFGPLCSYSLSG
jgi:hypothetical protein